MNNKIITAVVVVAVVAVVVLGGYFLLRGPAYKAPAPTPAPAPAPTPAPAPAPAPGTLPTPPPETPSEETTPTPTTQEPSDQNVMVSAVNYTDSGYSPNTLRVKAGETVIFINSSSKSMWTASAVHPTHTVYSGTSLSEHCGTSDNTAFDACKGVQPGDSWSFKFDKVGTWDYHNHLNPGDTGTIIVE